MDVRCQVVKRKKKPAQLMGPNGTMWMSIPFTAHITPPPPRPSIIEHNENDSTVEVVLAFLNAEA